MKKLNVLVERHYSWLEHFDTHCGIGKSCAIFRNVSDRKDDDTKEIRDNTTNLEREISQTFVVKLCTFFLVDFLHLVFIRFLMWHNENN